MSIEFRDLKRQYNYIKEPIDNQIKSIISNAQFVSGREVKQLEGLLADYVGRKYCISCANGTDAISIALIAAGVGSGDAVFVPDFTFFSSGESPAICGATPIFVDVDKNTYNISAESLVAAIESVISDGQIIPRAVIAVDLFGRPFDYDAISSICEQYNLFLLEDAAQGFGGEYTTVSGEKIKAGKLGNISTTSFFPAKPLGCYGDGGAIFTDDEHLANMCRSIAVHGKDMSNPNDPNSKYNNIRLGMNSRLDTIQAGILIAKFPVFKDEELYKVNSVACRYTELLSDTELILPNIDERYYSSWAQYTVQLPDYLNRNEIQKSLKEDGIPTNIYYIKPLHRQGAFESTISSLANCPTTDYLCDKVLCLPIHPYLLDDEIVFITEKLRLSIRSIVN